MRFVKNQSVKGIVRMTIALLACLALVGWLVYKQDFDVIRSVDVGSIMSCLLLILACYSCSGAQYYQTVRQLGCQMNGLDIVLYPLMNSLWGLIIPVQGAALFGALYLKLKYRFKVSSSVVVIVFLYLMNFLFGGVAWLAYAMMADECSPLALPIAALMLGMPLYLLIFRQLVRRMGRIPLIPSRIQDGLCECLDSLQVLFSNMRGMTILAALQLLRQMLMALMFVVVGKSCGFKVTMLWGYLVAVSQELSLVFKFTPGNIGLAEMVSGLVSSITGVSATDGVTVSLICNVLNVMLCLTVGFVGSWMFFHSYALKLKDVLSFFRQSRRK